jgi:putative ABC transport system substrate-binding protein
VAFGCNGKKQVDRNRHEEKTMWSRVIGCLVTLILSVLAVPLPADAQPAAPVPRSGVLLRPDSTLPLEEFRQGLRDLGWVEGQNIALEVRRGDTEPLPALAAELVRLQVDVLVTMTTPAALAARAATPTIPIVLAAVAHPVQQGLIARLARPGGNITGGTHSHGPEFFSTGLELLQEATPGLSRVAVLFTASGGLFVFPIGLLNTHAKLIADFATTHRLSTMFHRQESVQAGGRRSSYPDQSALRQRAATYVDKIPQGAKPADLPVEQPMKFEPVINLKTAQALGITIPPSVLFRADEVSR